MLVAACLSVLASRTFAAGPRIVSACLSNTTKHSMDEFQVDVEYPGTAVERLNCVHERVRSLTEEQLNADWDDVRRSLLWAGGLRDLTDVPPGRGAFWRCLPPSDYC